MYKFLPPRHTDNRHRQTRPTSSLWFNCCDPRLSSRPPAPRTRRVLFYAPATGDGPSRTSDLSPLPLNLSGRQRPPRRRRRGARAAARRAAPSFLDARPHVNTVKTAINKKSTLTHLTEVCPRRGDILLSQPSRRGQETRRVRVGAAGDGHAFNDG